MYWPLHGGQRIIEIFGNRHDVEYNRSQRGIE